MPKVSVIGAGRVGATTAQLIAIKGLADVVLVNRTVGTAQGIALDISQSLPVERANVTVKGTGDYADIAGSDIVVITAGAQRKEGMSRDDLLKVNAQIVGGIAKEIKSKAPSSKVIVVSNPLDAMVYITKKITGFDKRSVIGMAGALDSSRFSSFIAAELKASVNEISSTVLGSHGDSMVPLPRFTTVSKKPITELISPERLNQLVERTRNAGAEIIKLEESSAFYAPASCVVSMVESILKDEKEVIPCSVYAQGEYGINGVYIGLPTQLGWAGAEKIVGLELSQKELKMLSDSAAKIKAMMDQIDKMQL
ncbi:MAG: malate dehydrogenase [Candidatus Micrarchaeota archaeon]|nr:malate dehydrogenase [Candidatus Micrarchaeota archaeon]MDE1859108.1 malate dehydrogenase [Candidatus Micrarchaeota archaeon]